MGHAERGSGERELLGQEGVLGREEPEEEKEVKKEEEEEEEVEEE